MLQSCWASDWCSGGMPSSNGAPWRTAVLTGWRLCQVRARHGYSHHPSEGTGGGLDHNTEAGDICYCTAEGRIEESDGSLMCSYHGWRFNGEGACTRIPQALDPKAEATACSSSRACAAAFPTQACVLHAPLAHHMPALMKLPTVTGNATA